MKRVSTITELPLVHLFLSVLPLFVNNTSCDRFLLIKEIYNYCIEIVVYKKK